MKETAIKTEVINQSIQMWTQEPGKAKVAPVIKAQSDGRQAKLSGGPFSWRADLPPTLGGENKEPSPTALLLGALSGCAVLFIQNTLAPQLGVRVNSVQAEAKCKGDFRGLLGMSGAIPDLEGLEINITIQSPDSEDKVRRLYQAWLERCPVYLALAKPMAVKATLAMTS